MKRRSLIQRLTGLKFLSALANFIFVVINEVLGAPIARESYFAITGGVIAWITGESYIDGKAVGK